MKKNVLSKLLLLLLVLGIASCKKDSTTSPATSDSYVKFNVNGNWVTYKGLGELGPDLDDATKTDLVISGNSDDNKNNFSISVQVDGSNLNTGSYSSDQYPQSFVTVDYMISPDASTIKDYDIDDALGNEPSKYIVTLTSVSSTQIKGTFSGNYLYDSFNSDDADKGIVQITEGTFQLKRTK